MPVDIVAEPALPNRELVMKFESLGDNCEFGLVQRRVGAEPLGLFRFAGAPLRHLIRAMEARFEGMADPDQVRVQPENGEYMIKLTKYDFIYHADLKIGEADPDVLHKQQVRTVGFLFRKLITDLESPSKIMVFRQNEPLLANDLADLRLALASYGPATLLWVQPARPGHPPGTVVQVDPQLIVGYVSRLATRQNAPDFDLASWLTMLRAAYALHQDTDPGIRDNTPSLLRTHIVFGAAGNSAACTGYGWSAPENGFTWAIGDRSLLTIKKPGPAERFWLELDVVPFVAPPAVLAQSLRVMVNGELTHVFDPLARGKVGCAVPGRQVKDNEVVEIVLEHPNATSPRAATGENDDRRLAIAFQSVSLTAA
jgi:hypothetical protein